MNPPAGVSFDVVKPVRVRTVIRSHLLSGRFYGLNFLPVRRQDMESLGSEVAV